MMGNRYEFIDIQKDHSCRAIPDGGVKPFSIRAELNIDDTQTMNIN
jgi:hypothetical protein